MKKQMNYLRKVTSLVLAVAMVLSIVATQITFAKAEELAPTLGAVKRTVFYSESGKYFIPVKNLKDGKASNWKTTNSKVIKIIKKRDNDVSFETKKTGTSTISCTVKQGGKTYKLKTVITVKKTDPFSYVRINGKNIYKKDNYHVELKKKANEKVKVEWKLKGDWKVRESLYREIDNFDELKELKNKQTIKVSKKGTWVILELINSKEGIIFI